MTTPRTFALEVQRQGDPRWHVVGALSDKTHLLSQALRLLSLNYDAQEGDFATPIAIRLVIQPIKTEQE